MKQYTVEITDEALADMEEIYNHIAYVLLAPENAMGQYNRIADEILKLDVFPERFRIMDSEPEHAKGIRRMWVYNMGKELLEILASKNGIDVKKESIRNFQKIMEFSFEHPVMREIYMRRKDEYIMMRDIEHMLIELINALEYDITS